MGGKEKGAAIEECIKIKKQGQQWIKEGKKNKKRKKAPERVVSQDII